MELLSLNKFRDLALEKRQMRKIRGGDDCSDPYATGGGAQLYFGTIWYSWTSDWEKDGKGEYIGAAWEMVAMPDEP